MGEEALHIGLSAPASANEGEFILIEQEPWPDDVGRTSTSQGVMAIGAMIFGGSLPSANCGGLRGFDTPVYVFPSSRELRFVFDVTHGEFQKGVVETLTRDEIVQCGMQESVQTKYPVQSMQSMQWLGNCYDASGNVVAPPQITQVGRTLLFSKLVYGSLRVRYSVQRYTYNVRIEGRDDSIENNFDCVAFCVWDGGVEFKEIEAPSGYDATLGNCGNGFYGTDVTGGGSLTNLPGGSMGACTEDWAKGSYPKAVRADKHTKVNYCPQQIISEKVTESVDKENEAGEECGGEPVVTN